MVRIGIVEWRRKRQKPCPAESFQNTEQGLRFLPSVCRPLGYDGFVGAAAGVAAGAAGGAALAPTSFGVER
jgi:hypothetical protein